MVTEVAVREKVEWPSILVSLRNKRSLAQLAAVVESVVTLFVIAVASSTAVRSAFAGVNAICPSSGVGSSRTLRTC